MGVPYNSVLSVCDFYLINSVKRKKKTPNRIIFDPDAPFRCQSAQTDRARNLFFLFDRVRD
jgi:hypothetical protein